MQQCSARTRSKRVLLAVTLLVGPAVSAQTPPACIPGTLQAFSATGSLQTYAVPANAAAVVIIAEGAFGGTYSPGLCAGHGAHLAAQIPVTASSTLNVVVGGHGGTPDFAGGGGGGGSFVYTASDLLVAAGGGGGIGGEQIGPGQSACGFDAQLTTSGGSGGQPGDGSGGAGGAGGGAADGAGGGGFLGAGSSVGALGLAQGGHQISSPGDAAGGSGATPFGGTGGFGGGGGGGNTGGGGGGGYSGGGGAAGFGAGGGGSFVASSGTIFASSIGTGTGDGEVTICVSQTLSAAQVPALSRLGAVLMAVALLWLASWNLRRRRSVPASAPKILASQHGVGGGSRGESSMQSGRRL